MSNVEVKAGTCWRSHDCDDSWDRVRWNGDTLEYVFEDGTTESSGLEPAFFDDNPKTWKRVPDVSLRELSKALPALLAAARKVQNLLDEVVRDLAAFLVKCADEADARETPAEQQRQ